MRDFTLHQWQSLLCVLRKAGYVFLSFEDYLTAETLPKKFVVLRHDIDRQPRQALRMAELEHAMQVRASYYFRIRQKQQLPSLMSAISRLGFEVGYHYEDLTACKGDMQQAYQCFIEHLQWCRQYAPIQTICMHGNPRSRYDDKTLWQHYDFRTLGIIGETYLTTDFGRLCYFTDTGRRWDGDAVSVSDKIPGRQADWQEQGWRYHSTDDMIAAIRLGSFPSCVMLTSHPQRWHDNLLLWVYEWGRQNLVNIFKRIIVRNRK